MANVQIGLSMEGLAGLCLAGCLLGGIAAYGFDPGQRLLRRNSVTIVTWLATVDKCNLQGLNLEKSLKYSRCVVSLLAQARRQNGFSQTAIAKKTGLSRSAVSMIESGDRNPTLFVCHAIAHAIGVNLSSILATVEAEANSRGQKGK